MNILFTNFCNRNCPYCFAKGKLVLEKGLSSSYIQPRELRIIIDFLKQSKQIRVGILGGEPTLHPEFKRAVRMIIEEGIGVRIFSNGLMKEDIAIFLKGIEADKCNIVLNINSPESYTKKEWSVVNRTAGLLNKQTGLGFNIYRLDSDMDFMVDFIQKYNLKKNIRLAIAVPILGSKNKYVELTDYPKVSDKIVNFVERHRSTRISLSFDCGFILCSFTDEQLGRLSRLGTHMVSYCRPPVDVGPDLRLWSCFATSRIWNRKITDFKDLKAVHNFYNERFKVLHQIGVSSNCLRCEYSKLGYCSGGCLGHTLRSFKLNRLKELA